MPPASSNPAVPSAKRTLRRLFLTLFLRGRSARGLQKDATPKSVGRKLATTLLFYALFGMVVLAFRSQPVFMLSAYLHTMTLMFLGLFVASSAGEVLFNREEADILLHRPIEPQTLLWAKVLVLAEVSLWLAGAFNLAGLVVGTTLSQSSWRYLPAHVLSTALQAFFCTGSVVLVYQLCLRWFGRERLEGLMTAAQVALSVFVVLCTQMLPEVLKFFEQDTNRAGKAWWVLLVPPAWFAGVDDALAGSGAISSWALAGVGVGTTSLVLWLAFAKLARNYEIGLQMLNESSSKPVHQEGMRRRLDRLTDAVPLRWWLRDPRERAAFLLTAAYLARDRDVKLRVYPALAPFLMLPIIFMMRDLSREGPGEDGGFGIVFASAYLSIVPLMAVNLLQFSQNWQAADLFHIVPLAGPAPICHGARKAVLFLLALPLTLALAVSTWVIQANPEMLMLLIPGIIVLPVVALIPQLGGQSLPLSRPIEEAKSASRGLTMFGSLIATMALSGLAMQAWHYGWLGPLIAVESVVVAIAFVGLRRKLNCAPWTSLE